jgi:hypothetical protein
MSATLLPNAQQYFSDQNGDPLVNGYVYHYIPGTTTPKATWIDAAQTVQNTNPVVLDDSGRAIILGNGQYRQIVTDALGNTIWDLETGIPGASPAVTGSVGSETALVLGRLVAALADLGIITNGTGP